VVFQTLVGIHLEMVVIVIGVAVMLVHDVLAQKMIRERVAAFLIVGHCNVLPAAPFTRAPWRTGGYDTAHRAASKCKPFEGDGPRARDTAFGVRPVGARIRWSGRGDTMTRAIGRGRRAEKCF